jgi:hypothetical protein
MVKVDLWGEFEQPCPFGRLRCLPCDREPLGRAPQQRWVAGRFSGRHQQQQPGFLRQVLEAPEEALLDPA